MRAAHPLAALLCLGLIAASPAGDAPFADLEFRPVEQGAASPLAALMPLRGGRAALAAEDWNAAARAFASVLAHDPDVREARIGLAEAHLGADRADDARMALGTTEAPTLRLLIALELGELASPDTVLSEAFIRHRDARLANALGRWLDAQGRGRDARATFMRADPYQRAGVAQNNIGLSYIRDGDLDAAEAALAQAVSLGPDDPVFARNRRLCALMRGDYRAGLSGATADQAGTLLREAGASALERGEWRLAELLLTRAETATLRFDPRLAALQSELALRQQDGDPAEDAKGHR